MSIRCTLISVAVLISFTAFSSSAQNVDEDVIVLGQEITP
jgi:hypothetical protein